MTMESLIRKSWDYEIDLVGGVYYGVNSRNQVIDADATAINVLNACIADAPATGAVIKVHPDFDAGTSTLTLSKSAITIMNLNLNEMGGDTWDTPRIQKILLQDSGAPVKNNFFYGLNLREIEFQANSYNIDTTSIEKCQIRPSESEGQQGIRFTGTSSNGYTYIVRIIDCKINDQMNQSGINQGAISFEQDNNSCGQVWIDRLDYKPHDSNCILLSAEGRAIKIHLHSMNYVNMGETGAIVLNMRDGGQLTDVKIDNSLFELHGTAQTMFEIDNGASDSMKFMCDFSHNTFSMFESVEFIDNNAANGDWLSDVMNGIFGHLNLFKIGKANFSLGTPAVGSRFSFNVEFVEENTQDFVPDRYGGPLRWYTFGSGDDTINLDPDFMCLEGCISPNGTRANRYWKAPCEGYVSNLNVEIGTAPGGAGANAWTFTFEKNTVNQAVTVTITDPATTGSDTTNNFEVAKGDLLDIECTKTNAPNNTQVWGTWVLQKKLP